MVGSRTEVVVDTNVVWNVVYRNAPAAPWEELARFQDRFRFTLFSTTLLELFAQLEEGRLPWQVWVGERGRLLAVIDHDEPVSLFFPEDTSYSDRRALRQLYAEAFYWLIDFDDHADVFDCDEPIGIADAVAQIRQGYIELLEEPVQGSRAVGQPLLQQEFADWMLRNRPHLKRVAPLVRSFARFADLRARDGMAYNPFSVRRRGDAMDLLLLRALSLPAYIITEEQRLPTHVELAGAEHAERLVSIGHFLERARTDKLPQL